MKFALICLQRDAQLRVLLGRLCRERSPGRQCDPYSQAVSYGLGLVCKVFLK